MARAQNYFLPNTKWGALNVNQNAEAFNVIQLGIRMTLLVTLYSHCNVDINGLLVELNYRLSQNQIATREPKVNYTIAQ